MAKMFHVAVHTDDGICEEIELTEEEIKELIKDYIDSMKLFLNVTIAHGLPENILDSGVIIPKDRIIKINYYARDIV
jgi:hypothetical protein